MKRTFLLGCAAVAALAVGLMAGCGGYDRYDNAALYSVGSASLPASAVVAEVDIEWLAGEVIVEISPAATEISFTEETATADDALKLHYLDRAGELDSRFASSGADIPADFSKKLTVTVPASLAELDIQTTSANVTVKGVVGQDMKIETRSGNVACVLGEIAGFVLEFETRSGQLTDAYGAQLRGRDTYLFGAGGMEIDVETASGDLALRKT